jgi:hemerythrin-like domain-containing protein
MDGIELLREDHRALEALIRAYEDAASDAQRRALARTVVKALSRHASIDELIVYPLASGVLAQGDQAVADRLRALSNISHTLSAVNVALTGATPSREAVDRLMTTVREQVRQHVHADESELFPSLGDQLDHEALVGLALVLEQGKHYATTRPRPAAAHARSSRDLAPPVAAAFDRLCDRLNA